jgi:hypothetical protein
MESVAPLWQCGIRVNNIFIALYLYNLNHMYFFFIIILLLSIDMACRSSLQIVIIVKLFVHETI